MYYIACLDYWGATRSSIRKILMRSTFDYGFIAYMSASETNLKKLDIEQAQALTFKSSPDGDATKH